MDDTKYLRMILVGTDGSPGAMCAMSWAAKVASSNEAFVRAVHVLTYNRQLLRDLSLDTMTTWRRQLEDDLENRWVAPLTEAGVPHRCVVVEDDSPAMGLIKTADGEQVDLIVVGSRGQGRLAGRALGSTSYSLTHHARRPVVVVPEVWRSREP